MYICEQLFSSTGVIPARVIPELYHFLEKRLLEILLLRICVAFSLRQGVIPARVELTKTVMVVGEGSTKPIFFPNKEKEKAFSRNIFCHE